MLSLLSFIVAVLGVVGVLFSLRQAYRARLMQFQEKYVERYWAILDCLSLEALKASNESPALDDEKTIRRYMFLCEDELQLRGNGYISDATYHEWADGMLEQFRQPMFKAVWDEIQRDADHPKQGTFGFVKLKRLLDSAAEKGESGLEEAIKQADPLKQPPAVRMIRGLKGIVGP